MRSVIQAKKNGPLIVKNLRSLKNAQGDDILPEADTVFLCRCGKSNNKPFCDGTHKRAGFSSETNVPKVGKWKDYPGREITIHDNRRLCAHAGHCTHGLPDVWRMGETPWIDPDGADPEAIIAVVALCPSGALRYSVGGDRSEAERPTEGILVSKNGPYHISGTITLNDPSLDLEETPKKLALCRCGESKNKPFCDGSHWDTGFTDDSV